MTRRAEERVIRARERLKFRVYSSVRDVVLATELFRRQFQLHEPDIVVNVYAKFVDVNATLNEAQLRLVPPKGRARDLQRFAEELGSGFARIAAELHLGFTTDPACYGGSEPVMLVDVPCGYRAVLLRSEPE